MLMILGFISFSLDKRVAVSVLQHCLVTVGIWMRTKRLKLNLNKTEVGSKIHNVSTELSPCSKWDCTTPERASSQLGDYPGLPASPGCTGANCGQVRLCPALAGSPAMALPALIGSGHTIMTSRTDYCNALYIGLPLREDRGMAAKNWVFSVVAPIL